MIPLKTPLVALLLAGTGLAACTPGTGYQPPVIAAPAAFDGAPVASTTANRAWWTAFRDPALDRLLETGLKQNLTVKQAVERIEEARAGTGIAASADFPQISATVSGGRSDPTGAGAVTAQNGTLDAGWMLDLFGRARNGKAAARAQLDAAYAGADVARIAIAGAIAQTYVDLRYWQERIELTKQSRASRQETARLIASSLEQGSATRLDTLQADQLVAVAEAQLPQLEIGYMTALNRLATLTGQSSGVLAADLTRGAAQPVPHYRASVGIPADVLRNRPDVRVAERSLAAATAAVGVAKADFFPSVTLGGTITTASVRGGPSDTKTWSFGPSLNLPIFSGGKVRANLSAAESRARQAHLAWQETVLSAVEEIQTALAAYSRDGRNTAAQERLVSISQETVALARSTFELGEGDFLTVLEAERTLLDARAGLAEANRARALNFIRLAMATADGVPVK